MNFYLPSRAAPYAFAAIQALVTTGVSTLIGVWSSGSFRLLTWFTAWAEAWALLLPLVLALAPLIRRLLEALSRD